MSNTAERAQRLPQQDDVVVNVKDSSESGIVRKVALDAPEHLRFFVQWYPDDEGLSWRGWFGADDLVIIDDGPASSQSWLDEFDEQLRSDLVAS